jgi:hypothetical protein
MPDATPARLFGDEEILQVAVISDRPTGTVKEVVDDANEVSLRVSAKHEHWFGWVMQPRPSHVARLFQQRGFVEFKAALP